jgi:integrase
VGKKRGRTHGQGSIFKRMVAGKEVGWMAMLDMGIVDGKRKRKAFYGKTEKEVRDKLQDAGHSLRRGTLGRAGRLTVGDWLTRWLSDSAKPTTRPSTYRRYAQIVDQYLVPALGRIQLERLTASDVRSMLNSRARILSPRSLHHLRAVLRTALKVAMRDGLIPNNAAALAESPRVPASEMRTLGEDDVGRFQNAIRGNRLEALYCLALATGLRQGEALGLRWEDVDLKDGGQLRIRYALQRIGGAYTLVEPKSVKGRRTISPLPGVVVTALRDHKKRQDAEKETQGDRWLNNRNLVFTTEYGAPLSGSVVTHHFTNILKRSGLPHIRFHDLRHSCASFLLKQGVHPRAVMELLGHSQINLTLNTYSHVLPSVHKETAAAMDRVLTGK